MTCVICRDVEASGNTQFCGMCWKAVREDEDKDEDIYDVDAIAYGAKKAWEHAKKHMKKEKTQV